MLTKFQSVKEDIEEISNAAEKEARIEAKLAEIQEQWSEMAFTFADFKHKGNLILKGTETEAILDLLEESQTALSAMLSSRHVPHHPFCCFLLIVNPGILDHSKKSSQAGCRN